MIGYASFRKAKRRVSNHIEIVTGLIFKSQQLQQQYRLIWIFWRKRYLLSTRTIPNSLHMWMFYDIIHTVICRILSYTVICGQYINHYQYQETSQNCEANTSEFPEIYIRCLSFMNSFRIVTLVIRFRISSNSSSLFYMYV